MGWLELSSYAFGALGFVATGYQGRLWFREWQANRIDDFSAIERHSSEILSQIRQCGYKPDFVLGVGRSGALIGGWLAGNLGNVRIEVVDRLHKAGKSQTMEFPEIEERLTMLGRIYGDVAKVLVVEGATTRGTTFDEFERVRKITMPNWNCRFCVLYEVDTNMFELDFVAKKLPRAPESYPWHTTQDYKKFIRKTKSLDA